MNPVQVFSKEETKMIGKIYGNIIDKNYTKEEWQLMRSGMFEYIMSMSSKNGEISETMKQLREILEKIENCILKSE